MKHFIHMIFSFGNQESYSSQEGEEPDVGSQKSSLSARDSHKSRNDRVSILKEMPVPINLYHNFYL